MKLKGTAVNPALLLFMGLDKSGVHFGLLQQATFLPSLTKEWQSAAQEKLKEL